MGLPTDDDRCGRRRDDALRKALTRDLCRPDPAASIHSREQEPTVQVHATPARIGDDGQPAAVEHEPGEAELNRRGKGPGERDRLPGKTVPPEERDLPEVDALDEGHGAGRADFERDHL